MTVFLVGAGPGDPELLTLRALRLIRRADVIIHDRLVHPLVVAMARPGTLVIDAGRRRGRARARQAEIHAQMLRYRGRAVVVRLKGGDPYVFGRGGEEAEFLRRHRIPFEYVPGVTSAVAGPGYAGVPVTHRKISSSFTVVTAVGDYPWPRIDPRRPPGTLVVLMGAEGAAEVARRLLGSGFSPRTPVTAVRAATYPDQRTSRLSLARLASARLASPTVLVIGKVARAGSGARVAAGLPLAGVRVAVARAEGHTGEARRMLVALGARAEEVSVVRLAGRNKIQRPRGRFAGLVFTSAEGVRRAVESLGTDPVLMTRPVFAIGPRTADEVRRHLGIDPITPDSSDSAGLADLVIRNTRGGARLLSFRSSAASSELRLSLGRSGRAIVEIPLYDLVPVKFPKSPFRKADAVVTMASSCTRALARDRRLLKGKLVVAIGQQAAAPLKGRRDMDLVVAGRHDLDGVVAALLLATYVRSVV
ncbi:MAG TPA: uroporphyrinogen-III C-methyltransferase [Thermoplasmata archaeon]|nr:uroporphyrinogen-III C-methyltransferase [Thermoplasmata archaeon]